VFRYKEHAWSSFIPGCAEGGLERSVNPNDRSDPNNGTPRRSLAKSLQKLFVAEFWNK